jgi:hypothetical protein
MTIANCGDAGRPTRGRSQAPARGRRAVLIGATAVMLAGLTSGYGQEREVTAADERRERPPALLQALETSDLRLLYIHPTETYLAPYAARCFEISMAAQQSHFDWEPDEKVTVLLKDFSDYGNGAARANPRDAMLLDIAPMSFTFETFAPSERMFTLMNHELVHVATMDKANARDRRYRRLFGGKVYGNADHPESILYQYLTTPRTAVPRWYLEGIAVFMETWMAGGLGRAQGPYDEMVFRAMTRDDAHFYDPLGLASEGTKVDFQVGVNAYLYGARFMTYLAYRYSPEQLIAWVTRTEDSERYYLAQFERVFGQSMDAVWAEWIAFEKDFQRANLAAIRREPITVPRPLSDRALGSISRAFVDPGGERMYAAFRYPGVVAHVGEFSLRDGSVEPIRDVKGPMLYRVTSLAYDPAGGTLFYTADNYAYRDVMAVDLATGEERMLLEDARIGELVFNPADRSIWGVRHLNGIATLVRIPAPYTEWNQVWSLPYGELLYDLDISPDGSLLSASFGQVDGNQSLQIYDIEDLLAGRFESLRGFDFGAAVPEGFVFSPDGRYLYGSSFYTGVSNIFRYEVDTGDLQAVSNAETGFVRPIPLGDDRLIVFEYTGQGFVPSTIDARPLENLSSITLLGQQLVERRPVLKTWQVDSPATVDLDRRIEGEGDYIGWRDMSLESVYPVLEGYKGAVAGGVHANISDPLGFSKLGVTATFSPDWQQDADELSHLYLNYRYRAWTTELKYNYANFYDLFGPTKVALKGYSAEVTYDRALIYDKPRQLDLRVKAGYFGGLDSIPYAQDVDTTYDELWSGNVRLDYTNVRSSLGHVDDEKGYKWSAVAGGNLRSGTLIPYAFGLFDVGWALPLRHSSIWLRNTGGFADGDRDDDFANFYLGAFGNNWVDHLEVKRYREPFSFPGFDNNDIRGRTYWRSMLEWNLPPIRFRRAGTPSFFLTWARPAIFGSALVTDPEQGDSDTYGNLGAQVDFRMQMLSRLDLTLSVGYARGLADGSFDRNEFMLSLKIL